MEIVLGHLDPALGTIFEEVWLYFTYSVWTGLPA